MQLKLYIPSGDSSFVDAESEITINSEKDILSAGFAAARAVRAWLRSIPIVPSTGDLHFHFSAEMVADEPATKPAAIDKPAPRPKRKRKKE